ncbi:unnamed protein product, partial [Ascophyllum nodosum]
TDAAPYGRNGGRNPPDHRSRRRCGCCYSKPAGTSPKRIEFSFQKEIEGRRSEGREQEGRGVQERWEQRRQV